MAAHASLSASKTKEWAGCPGQIVFDEYMMNTNRAEPDVSGDAARMGTANHGLVEQCLETGTIPEDYEGRILEVVNPDEEDQEVKILRKGAKWPTDLTRVCYEVDEDVITATGHMVGYVYRRCMELDLCPHGGEKRDVAKQVAKLVKEGVVLLEARTNLFPHRDDTGGTGDVILLAPKMGIIEIVDYKNGTGIFVPVDENPQLRTYGMGSLQLVTEEYIESDFDVDYEHVRYTICQPRHHDAPEDGIMSEEITVQEMIDWRDGWLMDAIKRVDHARALFDAAREMKLKEDEEEFTAEEALQVLYENDTLCCNTGDHKCWFCERNTDYPGAKAKLTELAGIDFSDEPLDDDEEIDVPSKADELVEIMRWEQHMKNFFANARAAAQAIAMARKEVPGHKLVRGTKHKKFRDMDEDELLDELLFEFDLPKGAIVSNKIATASQALKVAQRKFKGDPEELKRFERRVIVHPKGDPELVLESDRRQVYVPDPPDADFEGEEVDE